MILWMLPWNEQTLVSILVCEISIYHRGTKTEVTRLNERTYVSVLYGPFFCRPVRVEAPMPFLWVIGFCTPAMTDKPLHVKHTARISKYSPAKSLPPSDRGEIDNVLSTCWEVCCDALPCAFSNLRGSRLWTPVVDIQDRVGTSVS